MVTFLAAAEVLFMALRRPRNQVLIDFCQVCQAKHLFLYHVTDCCVDSLQEPCSVFKRELFYFSFSHSPIYGFHESLSSNLTPRKVRAFTWACVPMLEVLNPSFEAQIEGNRGLRLYLTAGDSSLPSTGERFFTAFGALSQITAFMNIWVTFFRLDKKWACFREIYTSYQA